MDDSKIKKLMCCWICVCLTVTCDARIITVDDDGPADFSSIQAAIDDCNDGDVVIVAQGTYYQVINLKGKNITLRSTDPNDPNIVAGTIISSNDGTAVTFENGEGPNCVLSGFTITDGQAMDGGGIYCLSAPTLVSCLIRDNWAAAGAGMFNDGKPTLVNCIFERNSASDRGGGIYNSWRGEPTLINCIFRGNSASLYGGGMSNHYSFLIQPRLLNCTFTANSAERDGGGMDNENSSPTLVDCTFSGNSAGEFGGGMSNFAGDDDGSNPTLLNCTFSRNSAGRDGGGIYNFNGMLYCNLGDCRQQILTNCIFSGNSAESGGGVYNYSTNQVVTNCIFSGNLASEAGSGTCNHNSLATLANCTFTGNHAPDGNALACDSYLQDYPSEVQLTNCILWNGGNEIWNNDGSSITVTYSNLDGGWPGLGNIDVDPCFVEPGKWVDANDPNIMVEPNDPNAVWVDGDYHLKSQGWRWDTKFSPPRWTYDYVTSRCIDAGNPGLRLRNELLTIPPDPGHVWGQNLRVNMGAYGGTAQASMPPYDWALLSDITNDGIVDFIDFAHLANMYTDQDDELPADFDRDGDVDYDDLGLLAEDWLIQTTWPR